MTSSASDPPAGDAQDPFDREWAREAVRRHWAFINDSLARFVTLSAALAGGSVFLLTDWTLGWPFRVAVILFLAALVCALQGMSLAVAADLYRSSPEQIRQEGQRLLAAKSWWLQRSASAVLLGLALAAVGAILRGL